MCHSSAFIRIKSQIILVQGISSNVICMELGFHFSSLYCHLFMKEVHIFKCNLSSIQWCYSPNRALASTVFCLHTVLSLAASFQLRQCKNLAASCCTASSHLFRGFPTDLTSPNLALTAFLEICVPSIHWTCPAHLSLFSLIHVTRSGSPYSSYNSLLYLILHWPLPLTGP
jgi:hypothetical protein